MPIRLIFDHHILLFSFFFFFFFKNGEAGQTNHAIPHSEFLSTRQSSVDGVSSRLHRPVWFHQFSNSRQHQQGPATFLFVAPPSMHCSQRSLRLLS
jgi:hypothetical protein